MNWTEIVIKTPNEYAENAEAIAHMTVTYGIYIEDYSNLEEEIEAIAHINLIDADLLKKNRKITLIHIYIDPQDNPNEAVIFLKEHLSLAEIPFEIETSNVRQEDWANTWKQFYKPMKIGEKIVVCPSWEKYEKNEDEIILSLDPGMAFGTGSHDTTRLCLVYLQQFDLKDKLVLDLGSGSGILGISAALLGAKKVIGCDIDELAVKVANENAKINKVDQKTNFVCGNLTDKITGKFDIICANIVADVINIFIPQVKDFLETDGVFIASGIIDSRKDEVIENALKAGLDVFDIFEQKGWVAFAAKNNL